VTDDINIRLVKVEQRLDGLCRELNDEREETRRKSDRIFLALDELKKESANNKGFFGGVVFAVGAIFAVIAYVFGKS
jgi:VIT1/CCC1 family predicted Fe2+/Mn2+ transporter